MAFFWCNRYAETWTSGQDWTSRAQQLASAQTQGPEGEKGLMVLFFRQRSNSDKLPKSCMPEALAGLYHLCWGWSSTPDMSAMFGDFVRQCNYMYDLIIKPASTRIERRACENHARGKRDDSAVKSIWCSFRNLDPITYIQNLITPGLRNPTPPWASVSTYRFMYPALLTLYKIL